MRTNIIKYSLVLFFGLAAQFSLASGHKGERNIAEWNLTEENLGLKGYDPVSFFPEGEGIPALGEKDISVDYEGVIYNFVSMDNLNTFMEHPHKYEAAHGSWCSFAMASGRKIDFDPQYFEVDGNRLFLFVSEDALNDWKKSKSRLERRADRAWKRISGEDPRK